MPNILAIIFLIVAVIFFILYHYKKSQILYYGSIICLGIGVLIIILQFLLSQTGFLTKNSQEISNLEHAKNETKKVKIEKINPNLENQIENKENKIVKKECDREVSKITGRVIWVGDSRTVQLQNVLNWYPDINQGYDDYFSCKGSMGYHYFVETCIPEVANIKQAGDTIVMNMGVNDLANIDYYIDKMNELVNNDWSDCTVIYMTPNPVLDSVSLVKNYQIEEFNNKLATELDKKIIFMDSYSELIQKDFLNLEMDAEGVHYSNPLNGRFNTYEYIYNMVRNYEIEKEVCD